MKNRVYQWNMQKKYCVNIYDYDGHNPWHTVDKVPVIEVLASHDKSDAIKLGGKCIF